MLLSNYQFMLRQGTLAASVDEELVTPVRETARRIRAEAALKHDAASTITCSALALWPQSVEGVPCGREKGGNQNIIVLVLAC